MALRNNRFPDIFQIMSHITTHILDTSIGKPAADIPVVLFSEQNDHWTELKRSTTNADGRASDLLPKDQFLTKGQYKLRFEVKAYFDRKGIATFYPYVEIVFYVQSNEHYHVPLLVSPFGYSTYRGS